MSIISTLIIAGFTAPENIGTNPQSMLWLLPITAALSIVYKAVKLPKITPANFIKEVVLLFGSIIVVMAIIAVVLCTLVWLLTE